MALISKEIPMALGSLCQKWAKTKHIFLIVNHNIMPGKPGFFKSLLHCLEYLECFLLLYKLSRGSSSLTLITGHPQAVLHSMMYDVWLWVKSSRT